MRISLRSTSTWTFSKASAISIGPTEPNSLPSGPAFAGITSSMPSIAPARVLAAASSSAAAFSSSARRASISFMFSGVASAALPCGSR
jgi:hypothetical protein